jgi:mono/diheme cytochrome c family protein
VAKGRLVAIIILVVVLGAVAYWIVTADISAVNSPGRIESSVANGLREWYVGRGAKSVPASTVANNAESISQGEALYSMSCAQCHGVDGRKPMPIGKGMNPRVPDLRSADVQEMSDKEIFWVIKNGIRLSGMPGFAKLSTDPEIWQMTYYVRSLGARSVK